MIVIITTAIIFFAIISTLSHVVPINRVVYFIDNYLGYIAQNSFMTFAYIRSCYRYRLYRKLLLLLLLLLLL